MYGNYKGGRVNAINLSMQENMKVVDSDRDPKKAKSFDILFGQVSSEISEATQ